MPARELKVAFIICCSSAFLLFSLLPQNLSDSSAQASDQDKFQNAAQSVQWLKLLHYDHGRFGEHKSRVANADFFLSNQGPSNPEAELHATMAAFSREDSGQTPLKLGALGLSATCSFPARRLFVERELGYPPRKMKCDEYETWKSGIGAHAVSLVFSSAYPGSPGSLFGHTFLKFSRQPLATTQSKNLNHAVRFSSAEMLDYSLSFAAATGNAGPLAYFGYGLTGGFNGVFSLAPFYVKAQEYNAAEGRDLWLYDVHLEKTQVDLLVAHVWELMNLAMFRYYFFDENCASMLLDLLEVAQPKWTLRSQFLYAVLPSETVKALDVNGDAILNSRHLPSVVSEFRNSWGRLDAAQREEFNRAIFNPAAIESAPEPTLHALIKYTDWQKMRGKGELPEKDQLIRKRALKTLARADSPETSGAIKFESKAQDGATAHDFLVREIAGDPRLGHGPARLKLTYALQQRAKMVPEAPTHRLNLEYRFGFHGNQDPNLGYEPGLSIEYLRLRASAEDRKLWLSEFSVLEAQSLVPFEALGKQISYRTRLSYLDAATPDDSGAAIKFEAGPGIASAPDRPGSSAVAYALAIPSIRLGLASHAPKPQADAVGRPGDLGADLKLALGAKHSLPRDGMILVEAQPGLRSGWNLKLDISFALWPQARQGFPVTVLVQEMAISNPWSSGVKRPGWSIGWGGSFLF